MNVHDVLIGEVGAAIGVAGLLLVFLPLFVHFVRAAEGGNETASERHRRQAIAWGVVGMVAVTALDITAGLLTLWGMAKWAGLTGWLLLVITWLLVLAAAAVVRLEIT